MRFGICTLLAAFAMSASTEKIRYDGYTVKRITPHTQEQLATLKNLETLGASFWHDPSTINRHADVQLPPHMKDKLVKRMRMMGMEVEDFVEDVQELIDQEETVSVRAAPSGRLTWTKYGTLDQMNAFMVDQNQKHPDITTLHTIGKSYEGRDLLVMKISTGGIKPAIWMDGNIHAREWISSAMVTYIMNEILNGGSQAWAADFDWHIMPVSNPDGFNYTKTTNRLWRKNRSVHPTSSCRGADCNRNFDYRWLGGGSSTDPCSDLYAGSAAFSEPETQAMRDYITSINKLVAYLSFHSYGQYILIPFGDSNARIPQYNDYMTLGGNMADAIALRYRTRFTPGNVVDQLYVATGTSMDWVKETFNPNLTLTFELRDKGSNGFVLPDNQITPSCLEFMDGMKVLVDALRIGIPTPDLPP